MTRLIIFYWPSNFGGYYDATSEKEERRTGINQNNSHLKLGEMC